MKVRTTSPSRRSFFRLAASAAVVLTAIGGAQTAMAQAQSWPAKPVRVVVNFPPGGAADVMARLISQPVSEALGQPVVIENRAGANGNIGGEAVAKADPDGYTFLFSSGGVASVNPHLYKTMSFDPAKDLQPVAAAARVLVFLVTRPDVPVKSAKEFIDYAKKNPGKLSYGSPGNGSSPHLAAEMFNGAADIKTLHDTPTVAEVGLKGFDADSWFGFYAPAGVDKAIVDRMNQEVNKALALPTVRNRIAELGGVASPMSPAEFADKAKADFERFGSVIRERGISVQ